MPNTNPTAAPTPDNVSAAFRAMLSFLRYLLTGRVDVANLDPNDRIGVDAGDAIGLVMANHRDKLVTLRDLVQAGSTEHYQRTALAPAADPTDYPPAVLEEAEKAGRAAYDNHPGTLRESISAHANAYAAVLARHVVAVRLAAADTLTEEQAAAVDSTPAILTYDASTAGQFITTTADEFRIYDPEPSPEIARLTAERDKLRGHLISTARAFALEVADLIEPRPQRLHALREGVPLGGEVVAEGSPADQLFARGVLQADGEKAAR